ncbi:MAG: ribonuclease HII [Acidobacteria bacterium]|nr:ribonuclease HII [Acidobacteriota bacterium]
MDLEKMSVQEIRQHYLVNHLPASGQTMARLQRDPRQGVRAIYRILEKRRRAQKQKHIRMRSLLHFEELLWGAGIQYVAGVDEVGIGPLAGPVVAAAVIFPPHTFIDGIDDSKKLNPTQRADLREQILKHAVAHSIGVVDVEEVDRLNVYHAGLEAMRRAVLGLTPEPQHILVDAREIPGLHIPQNKFDKGDGINFSIAAASILAKTYRDGLMDQFDLQFPQYGFNSHKGYPTKQHQMALEKYGPCTIHRSSFPFVGEVCGKFGATFYQLKASLLAASSPAALKRAEDHFRATGTQLTEHEVRKLRICCKRLWSQMSSRQNPGRRRVTF